MKRTLEIGLQTLRVGFVIALLVEAGGPAWAQPSSMRFEHLGRDDGLSQNTITSIVQGEKGFLSFGTYNGLNRYDGYTVTTFHRNPDEEQSLRRPSRTLLDSGFPLRSTAEVQHRLSGVDDGAQNKEGALLSG